MYYGKVDICGINTAKLPVLSEKEKTELLKRAKNGDKAARETMINGNLRLVLSVVQKFASRGENPDDLFQVGCIGLIKAIDNFDPNLDVRFSTYGVPMIIGEIRRFLRDSNPVRVSRSMRDTAYRAMQIKEAFINEHGREPKIEEIEKEVGQMATICLYITARMNASLQGHMVFLGNGIVQKFSSELQLLHVLHENVLQQDDQRERKII